MIRSNQAKLLELLQKLAANWSRALYNDFHFGIATTLHWGMATWVWIIDFGSVASIASLLFDRQ